MLERIKIFCCNCNEIVEARLTNGAEIYPHRQDLDAIPLWIHDKCGGYVGCHHKTKNSTRPLGVIPSKAIKAHRKEIHRLLDPMWQHQDRPYLARKKMYNDLSNLLGYEYHTAELRTEEECLKVIEYLKGLSK